MGCTQSRPVGPSSSSSDDDPAAAAAADPSALRLRSPISGKKFFTFISHFKFEAAADARFLQMELERILQRKVFLDNDVRVK